MLHRRGPDTLPSSPFLFWTLLALSIVAEWVILLVAGAPARVFAVSLLVAGFDLWFFWAMLRTFNRAARFRQTMTAILGTDLLLTLLQAPLVQPYVDTPPPDPENQSLTLAGALTLLIIVWSVDISAFVLTRSLERPYLLCVSVAIGYFFLIYSLQVTL